MHTALSASLKPQHVQEGHQLAVSTEQEPYTLCSACPHSPCGPCPQTPSTPLWRLSSSSPCSGLLGLLPLGSSPGSAVLLDVHEASSSFTCRQQRLDVGLSPCILPLPLPPRQTPRFPESPSADASATEPHVLPGTAPRSLAPGRCEHSLHPGFLSTSRVLDAARE